MASDADSILGPQIGPPDYDEMWDAVDDRHFDRKGNPISMRDWARLLHWQENGDWYKRVGLTMVGQYRISTVWLGLDHGLGKPFDQLAIFETMVFDDSGENRDLDLDQRRYSTEEEAIEGHRRMVEEVELFAGLEVQTKGKDDIQG